MSEQGTTVNVIADDLITVELSASGPAGPGVAPATVAVLGTVTLSTTPENAAIPIAVTTTDPRMSNARVPLAHKVTHAIGGSDVLSPADIGAATAAGLTSEISNREAADAIEKARAEAAEATLATASGLIAEKERAETAEGTKLAKVSNLSDLTSASTARTNLGLGSAAVESISAFDAAGTATAAVAIEKARAEAAEATKASTVSLTSETTAREAADKTEKERAESAEVTKLVKASNLSDLTNAATARTNLGLGSAATEPKTAFDAAGTAAAEVAIEKTRAEIAENLKATKVELNKVTLGTDWSVGELVAMQITSPPNPHKFEIRDGSAESPVKIGVTASISRVDATSRAEVNEMGVTGSDGADGATAMRIGIKGSPSSQVQTVALALKSWHLGTSNGGEASADATPLWSKALVSGSGVGRAIGAYFESARETATSAGQQGIEIRVKNSSGSDDTYNTGGGSKSMGIWMAASGTNNSAAAFQIGQNTGKAFEVGFGANPGTITGSMIRDESSSIRSVLIKGTHEKAAIAIASGANGIVIGAESFATEKALLEIVAPGETVDPLYTFGNATKANSYDGHLIRNSGGYVQVFVSGATNGFFTGTVAGDSGLMYAPGKTLFLGARSKTPLLRATESLVTIGEGEHLFGFGAQNVAAKKVELLLGTSAAPDEGNQPLLSATRVLKTPEASFSGDGAGNLGAIRAHTQAVAGSEGQALGVVGSAITLSTYEAGHSLADGIGGYFLGIAKGESTRTGMGAFLNGRRENLTGRAVGAEICATNEVEGGDQEFTGGLPGTMAIHLHPAGKSRVAAGIVVREQTSSGVKFHTGIGVMNGSVTNSFITDYTEAAYGLLLKGKKTKASIAIGKEAGGIVIGEEEFKNEKAKFGLEVNLGSLTEGLDPMISFKGPASKSSRVRLIENGGTGQVNCFVAAATNAFVLGTVANDSGIGFGPGTTLHIGANAKTSVLRITEASATFTTALAMSSQKITGLANGTVSTDAAAFGQIPTSLPPSGTAGGVLAGTYPNPELAESVAGGGIGISANVLSVAAGTGITQEANGIAVDTTVIATKSFVETGLGTKPTATLDTDGTLAANSDTAVASQKATKTYADTKIAKTLVDAKGDVLTATANDTPARLGVGSDGQALVAASGEATGLKWAAPAPATHASTHQLGGTDALALPQYDPYDLLPGVIPQGLTPGTTQAPVAKRIYFVRFTVPRKRQFKFVRWALGNVGTGTEEKNDAGIYVVEGSKLKRLGSSGAIKTNMTSVGVKTNEMTGTVTCEPNTVYYVATAWETITGTPQTLALLNNNGSVGDIFGTGTLANRSQLIKSETFPLPETVETFTSSPCTWAVPSES